MKMNLEDIAQAMVAPGKGILAADESTGTIKKRFDSIKVESTFENRRDYREMLFSAKAAMKKNISGVILFDETIRQRTANDKQSLVELMLASGSIPGIKVDAGAQDLAGYPNEKITEGLDGLRGRLKEYYKLGRASPNGAPSSPLATRCRPTTASTPTPMRWPATPPCARKTASCRSSSRKCSWTASSPPTTSNTATK
jgi:hypothetical protein